jgi:hypothetical protein
MAKRRKRRTSRPVRKDDYPGWLWMLFGLAIGLSVAFAVYMQDRRTVTEERPVPRPASLETAIDDNGEDPGDAAGESAGSRFTFYDMLPNFEVVIPEQEPDVAADTGPQAVLEPGVYVLQAGSFSAYADADRRRAQLALQGIESKIQRVTIDDRTYHRVRIGPTRDLDELNMMRSRLRAAQIDVLRIRLGD